MMWSLLLVAVSTALPSPSSTWHTSHNQVFLDGQPVSLHGIGTTCMEYIISGVGVPCFASYDWNNASDVMAHPDTKVLNAMLGYLNASKGVQPVVRVPVTAAYWLNVNLPKTYPNISGQYRTLLAAMVDTFTQAGVAVIIDLHWNDDTTKQQPMALKGSANAVDFWDSVSAHFGNNKLVLFELYNEPHIDDYNIYAHGDSTYAGMLEMYAAVRKNAPNSMVVIGGQKDYAYDATSLAQLAKDAVLTNVLYNFHPYMGPMQQSDIAKSASGFEGLVKSLAGMPLIVTEFGQYCCPSDGACYAFDGQWQGQKMGYVEAILQICAQYNVSWMGWAWRPQATAASCDSPDMNGENGDALKLTSASTGEGANWAKLFAKYF